MRQRRFKRWVCSIVVLAFGAASGAPSVALAGSAGDESSGMSIDTRIASVLLPGAGQAQQGHYTKAALFASAAVFSGAGFLLTQVHYNRARERYEDQKRIYLDYPKLLNSQTVAYSDIEATRAEMQAAFDAADERATWRNVFLGAFVAVYALNLVDLIVSNPDTGEGSASSPVSLEMREGDVRLVKTFSF